MNCFFSLIIASKNEEKDIYLSLDSSLKQKYKNYEIIVIDDSTDGTKNIIRDYQKRFDNLFLIEGEGTGCCNARNKGIYASKGDIIVFLTADTILEPNYLLELNHFYKDQNTQWITTSAKVYNLDNNFSRFLEFQHQEVESRSSYHPYTTQGYSVRKNAALNVDCISGDKYPFNFCRDWTLGEKLNKQGYKKLHISDLTVFHKAPNDYKDYFQVRKTRGLMSAYQPYYFFNKNLSYLFIKFFTKTMISFLKLIFVIPLFFEYLKILRFSDKKTQDFFPLIFPFLIQEFCFRYGELVGLKNILKRK